MDTCEKATWVLNAFDKSLYAPFTVKCDSDYFDDLSERFNRFHQICADAGADSESLTIVDSYTLGVLEALELFYSGNICAAHETIKKLVTQCDSAPLAVAPVNSSSVFPGAAGSELQLFHARIGDPRGFKANEMLHLPYSKRGLSGAYRFSIPGLPSYYLANSSYGCWLELGQPAERELNVSPVLLDGTQKVFNLAVMSRDVHLLNELNLNEVHAWLKLMTLMIATSYVVEEKNRTFKSEYLISQSIMLACKDIGLDGVAYFSKRVTDEVFARAAVNLALFTNYEPGKSHGDVCRHLKVGDSFNYMMFRQLGAMNEYEEYELRCLRTGLITNIGTYERQRSYHETDFCAFDRFLFCEWKNKDRITWGSMLDNTN